jgi:photosystem II stability/assembly factor-like uncharacterized protein
MRMKLLALSALCTAAVSAHAQWIPQQSGTDAEFRGLVAVSPTVVWVSGTKNRVAHSTDGGRTWKVDTVATGAVLDLRAVAASSATLAWALSAGPAEQGQAQIFRTDDGAHWVKQFETTEKGVFLDALAFWDKQHGIALSDPVGGQLFILTTDDGGRTWARVAATGATAVLPNEGAFAASGTCLIVQGSASVWIGTGGASRARVFRSSDRGRSWSVADTPIHAGNAASGIFSVAFSDARHGVAVGGEYSKPKEAFDNVALTSDGGQTWRLAHGPLPPGYMSGVAFIPGTEGRSLVAVGLAGTATSHDGGESWTMVDTVAYNSVVFASRTDGWAAGPKGRIAKWAPTPGASKP